MKIAVASQTRTQVTGHTGHCQRFWIYQVKDNQVQEKSLLELTKAQSFHESSPLDPHPLDGIEVLICGGFGKGLGRRLAGMGIQAIATSETDLEQAIQGFLSGTLPSQDADNAHHHHHHHHNSAATAAEEHECNCHGDE